MLLSSVFYRPLTVVDWSQTAVSNTKILLLLLFFGFKIIVFVLFRLRSMPKTGNFVIKIILPSQFGCDFLHQNEVINKIIFIDMFNAPKGYKITNNKSTLLKWFENRKEVIVFPFTMHNGDPSEPDPLLLFIAYSALNSSSLWLQFYIIIILARLLIFIVIREKNVLNFFLLLKMSVYCIFIWTLVSDKTWHMWKCSLIV